MPLIKLTVSGEPVAKSRPRVTRNGHAYTPTKTKNYETLIKELFIINYPAQRLLEGELKAEINAYFAIPKSASKKNKALMQEEVLRPTKRPDADNVAKSILDALNGLAYKDDSQVVTLVVSKYYSDRPRVELEIKRIEKGA